MRSGNPRFGEHKHRRRRRARGAVVRPVGDQITLAIEQGFRTDNGVVKTGQGLSLAHFDFADGVFLRLNRLWLDVYSGPGAGATLELDLGPASMLVGMGFMDLIIRAYKPAADQYRMKVWLGPACDAGAAVLLADETWTVPNGYAYGGIDQLNYFYNTNFNEPPKGIWVAKSENEDDSGANNPYGVPNP